MLLPTDLQNHSNDTIICQTSLTAAGSPRFLTRRQHHQHTYRHWTVHTLSLSNRLVLPVDEILPPSLRPCISVENANMSSPTHASLYLCLNSRLQRGLSSHSHHPFLLWLLLVGHPVSPDWLVHLPLDMVGTGTRGRSLTYVKRRPSLSRHLSSGAPYTLVV